MAGDPNAFAFQMALLMCAALSLIDPKRSSFPVSIALAAIILSASRAGIMAAAVIVLTVLLMMPRQRMSLVLSVVSAAAIVGLITLASNVSGAALLLPTLLVEGSDNERLLTLVGGWNLFLNHPLFGAGLGAFAEGWRQAHGAVQVIHSTPLWLLAEFGLLGFAVFALPFVQLLAHAVPRAFQRDETATLITLTCIAFIVMGAAHEIFYQRAFWLFLGSCLALPLGLAARRNAVAGWQRPGLSRANSPPF